MTLTGRAIDTDSPAGFTGSDSILVTAAEAGEYRVAVEPSDPKADAGLYVIRLAEIRPTVAEDLQVNEAALKVRQLAEKAASLRARGTQEERRQAVLKLDFDASRENATGGSLADWTTY